MLAERDLPRGISSDDFEDHLVQVSNGDRVIFRSPTAPTTRIEMPVGIHNVAIGEDRWKALRQIDAKNGDTVIVAVRRFEVDTTIITTLASVLVPLAGAAVLSTLLTLVLVSHLLKPLEKWARKIGDLSPYGTGTIDGEGALSEVRPVLSAVNRMLDRVRASVAFERRFVRDAAHELRTPLTAIRTQIEAGDWSGLSGEQQRRMTNVHFGLQRATRLVNQLMDLARAEEPRAPTGERRIELGAFIGEKLTDLINSGSISDPTRLSLNAPDGETWLTCQPGDIEIVLTNLVDNAVKYAGDKAEIAVTLDHEGDRLNSSWRTTAPVFPRTNASRCSSGSSVSRPPPAMGRASGSRS